MFVALLICVSLVVHKTVVARKNIAKVSKDTNTSPQV